MDNKSNKLMMTCYQFTMLSTKMQYKETSLSIGFLEKVGFRIHTISCPPCGKYHKANTTLTHLLEEYYAKNKKQAGLSEHARHNIREALLKHGLNY